MKAQKRKRQGKPGEELTPTKKSKNDFNHIVFIHQLRDAELSFQALQKFVEESEKEVKDPSQDIVACYCRSSPECAEIFKLLEAGKRKTAEVHSIFAVLEAIMIKIAGKPDKFAVTGNNIVKKLLSAHVGSIYACLSPGNKSSQIKTAIKLLTAMVLIGEQSAKAVLTQIDLNHKSIKPLFNRRDRKDPQDVRTCMIHFVLSFLMTESDSVLKLLLLQKGFLSNIFGGMKYDSCEILQLTLDTLLKKLVRNKSVSKTLKVQVFSEHALKQLSQLYHWLGPSGWEVEKQAANDSLLEQAVPEDGRTEEQKFIADAVQQLLLELCSNVKNGITFFDKSFGTSGKNHNPILTGFLASLVRITDDPLVQDLLSETFRTCPDQIQPFLCQGVLLNSLPPRPSPKWLAMMQMICTILEKQPMKPAALKLQDPLPVKNFVSMCQVGVLPPSQVLHILLQGLKHKSMAVRHAVIQVVKTVLEKAGAALEHLKQEDMGYTKLEREEIIESFTDEVLKELPSPKALFACWDKLVAPPNPEENCLDADAGTDDVALVSETDHMVCLEQTLCLYQSLLPSVLLDGPSDIGKLVEGVTRLMAQLEDQTETDSSEGVTRLMAQLEDQTETDSSEGVTRLMAQLEDQTETDSSEGVTRLMAQLEDQTETDSSAFLPLAYLLKLLSGTDARKLPWTKENADGHSLVYLLLDLLRRISLGTTRSILKVITSLICNLLSGTGLFDHQLEELDLVMKHFIHCVRSCDQTTNTNDDDDTRTENSRPVVLYLTKVLTTYISNPYPYGDKVSDFVSETVMDTPTDETMDTISNLTSDSMIDTILEMDEEDIKDFVEDNPVNSSTARFPFSPLFVVALAKLETLQETEGITKVQTFVQGILIDLLHRQIDPQTLVVMVKDNPKCLGEDFVKIFLFMKDVKGFDSDFSENTFWTLSSQSLLRMFISLGREKQDLDFTQVEMTDSQEETTHVIHQLILYITLLLQKGSQTDSENVQKLFQCLYGAVEKVLEYAQTHENEEKTETPSEEEESFRHLVPPTLSTTEKVIDRVLTCPILLDLFICQVDKNPLKSNVQQHTRENWAVSIVTESMLKILELIKSCKCGKLSVDGPLLQYFKKAENSLADTSYFSSKRNHVFYWCGKALALLLVNVPKFEKIELLKTLLSISKKCDVTVLVSEILNDILRTPEPMDFTNSLLGRDILQLTDIAAQSESSEHLHTLEKLFSTYPTYTTVISPSFFTFLWNKRPNSSCLNIMKIAVHINKTCRDQLEKLLLSYVEDAVKKKSKCRTEHYDFLPVLNAYLHRKTSLDSTTKQCLINFLKTEIQVLGNDLDEDCCEFIHQLWLLKAFDKSTRDQLFQALKSCMLHSCHLGLLQKISPIPAPSSSYLKENTAQPHSVEEEMRRSKHSEDRDNSFLGPEDLFEICQQCLISRLQKNGTRNEAVEKKSLELMASFPVDCLQHISREVLTKKFGTLLKLCLKHLYTEKTMYEALEKLISIIYENAQETDTVIDVKTLFAMVTSHSLFLPIMFNESHGDVKENLIDLLLMLVQLDPSCCSGSHVGVYLGAYGATMTPLDQKLLKLMHFYERNGISMSEYRPFLWGSKAVENHSVRKALEASLWKVPSADHVLELVDKERMYRSVLGFPLRRGLQSEDLQDIDSSTDPHEIYDPCFMLPVLSNMLKSDSLVNCRKFIETNCLSYSIAALSSHSSETRGAAYHILSSYFLHLEGAKFPEQKQIIYALELLRDSIEKPNAKLPCIITIFFAKALLVMLKPESHMYQLLNEFLLLKPSMDIANVPEFYKLFNSSSLQFKQERQWILDLLVDGLRETGDYRIMEKRFIFKLLLSFHDSVLSDNSAQIQVLKVVCKACCQRTVAVDLVKNHGMLSWLLGAIRHSKEDKMSIFTNILHDLWFTLLMIKKSKNDGKNTRDLPVGVTQEMQLCALELLRHFRKNAERKSFIKLLEVLQSINNQLMSRVAGAEPLILQPSDVAIILSISSHILRDFSAKEKLLTLLSNMNEADIRQETICRSRQKETVVPVKTSDPEPSNVDLTLAENSTLAGEKLSATNAEVNKSERSSSSSSNQELCRLVVSVCVQWNLSNSYCLVEDDQVQLKLLVEFCKISVSYWQEQKNGDVLKVLQWMKQMLLRKGSNGESLLLHLEVDSKELDQLILCLLPLYAWFYMNALPPPPCPPPPPPLSSSLGDPEEDGIHILNEILSGLCVQRVQNSTDGGLLEWAKVLAGDIGDCDVRSLQICCHLLGMPAPDDLKDPMNLRPAHTNVQRDSVNTKEHRDGHSSPTSPKLKQNKIASGKKLKKKF